MAMNPSISHSKLSCLWCSRTAFMKCHLEEYIDYKPDAQFNIKSFGQPPSWLKPADSDLLTCLDCVMTYHKLVSARNHVLNIKAPYKRTKLRIIEHFEFCLDLPDLSFDHCKVSVTEVLMYPRLLLNKKVSELFIEILLKLGESAVIDKKLPGVYLLLVYPEKSVRDWAETCVRKLGSIDYESYDDIIEVIGWILTVAIYNLFDEPPSSAGVAAWMLTEPVCLPHYLVVYESRGDFWNGLYAMTSVINSSCIKRLCNDSHYAEFVNIVLGLFEENSSVFFPALKIVSLLLQKLGSQFWKLCSTLPKDVMTMILSHNSFYRELQAWVKVERKGEGVDETEESSPHSVILSWVVPLTHTLIDYGNQMEPVISSLLEFLSTIAAISLQLKPVFKQSLLLGYLPPPKVTLSPQNLKSVVSIKDMSNESMYLLVVLVELLYDEGHYKVLVKNISKWLPLINSIYNTIVTLDSNSDDATFVPTCISSVKNLVRSLFSNSIGRACASYDAVLFYSQSDGCTASDSSSRKDTLTIKTLCEDIVKILEEMAKLHVHEIGIEEGGAVSSTTSGLEDEGNVSDDNVPDEASQALENEENDSFQTGPLHESDTEQGQIVADIEDDAEKEPLCSTGDFKSQEEQQKEELHKEEDELGSSISSDHTATDTSAASEPPILHDEESSSCISEQQDNKPKISLESSTNKYEGNSSGCEDVIIVAVEPPKSSCSSSTSDSLPSFYDMLHTKEKLSHPISNGEKGKKKFRKRKRSRSSSASHSSTTADSDSETNSTRIPPKKRLSPKRRSRKSTPPTKYSPVTSGCSSSAINLSPLISVKTNLLSSPSISEIEEKNSEIEEKSSHDEIESTSTSTIMSPSIIHGSLSLQVDDCSDSSSDDDNVMMLAESSKCPPEFAAAKPMDFDSETTLSRDTDESLDSTLHVPHDNNTSIPACNISGNPAPIHCLSLKLNKRKQHQYTEIGNPLKRRRLVDESCFMDSSSTETLSATEEPPDTGLLANTKDSELTNSITINSNKVSSLTESGGHTATGPVSPSDASNTLNVSTVAEGDTANTPLPTSDANSKASEGLSPMQTDSVAATSKSITNRKESVDPLQSPLPPPLPFSPSPCIPLKVCSSLRSSITQIDDLQLLSLDSLSPLVYNELHLMPTCIGSSHKNLCTKQYKRVGPCRVKVAKCNPSSVEVDSVEAYEKYDTECREFLRAQGIVKPLSLVISIPLKVLDYAPPLQEEQNAREETGEIAQSNRVERICHSDDSDNDEFAADGRNTNFDIFSNSQINYERETFVFEEEEEERECVLPLLAETSGSEENLCLALSPDESEDDIFRNSQVVVGEEEIILEEGGEARSVSLSLACGSTQSSSSISSSSKKDANSDNPEASCAISSACNSGERPLVPSNISSSPSSNVYNPVLDPRNKGVTRSAPFSGSSLPLTVTTVSSHLSSPLSPLLSSSSISLSPGSPLSPSPFPFVHVPPPPPLLFPSPSSLPPVPALPISPPHPPHLLPFPSPPPLTPSLTPPPSSIPPPPLSLTPPPPPPPSLPPPLTPPPPPSLTPPPPSLLPPPPPLTLLPSVPPPTVPTKVKLSTKAQCTSSSNDCPPLSPVPSFESVSNSPTYPTQQAPPFRPNPNKGKATSGGSFERPRSVSIDTTPKKKHSASELNSSFLAWPPHIFHSPGLDSNGCPIRPLLQECVEAVPVPDVFSSYDDYVSIMKPLLLMEICDNVYDAIRSKHCSPYLKAVVIDCKQYPSEPSSCLYTMSCRVSVPKAQINNWLSEEYLVLFEAAGDTGDGSEVEAANTMDLEQEQKFGLVVNVFTRNEPSPSESKKIEICVQFCSVVAPDIKCINLRFVTYLSTFIRKWYGLINLHRNQVVRDLMNPRGGPYFCSKTNEEPNGDYDSNGTTYNAQQSLAISSAVSMVKDAFSIPRVLMVSGLPGTGKTHTVIGMVDAILKELKPNKSFPSAVPGSSSSQRKPHLFVCAHSAPAIDEIILRLKDLKLISNERSRSCYSLVYFGYSSHTNINKEFTLDELVKQEKGASSLSKAEQKDCDRIKSKLSDVDKDINIMKHKKENERAGNDALKKLEKLRKGLVEEMNKLMSKNKGSTCNNDELRRNLLLNADIVCCTLNSAGRKLLRNLFSSKNQLHFSCIIIDDASRCSELETLIPLEYGCNKIILLGDPGFLSTPRTTPISPDQQIMRTTEKFRIGQSLFQRLLHCFSGNKGPSSVVRSLEVQYRMSPFLCHFPSQHFYRGRLRSDTSLTETYAQSKRLLKPFIFFNTTAPSSNANYFLLKKLVHALLESGVLPRKLGIINYDKRRTAKLKEWLSNDFGRTFELGTVDTFEGKDKDFIILYMCDNGIDASNDLGILNDVCCMITALTRAKKGCYIIGNESYLKLNKDWEAMLQYASNTLAIVNCTDPEQYSEYVKSILSSPSSSPSTESSITSAPPPTSTCITATCVATVVSSAVDPRLNKKAAASSTESLTNVAATCSASLPFYKSTPEPTYSVASRDGITCQPETNTLVSIRDSPSATSITNSIPLTRSTFSSVESELELSSESSSGEEEEEEDERGSRDFDHERLPSWPDSQQVSSERPQLVNYHDIDLNKNFPPPPPAYKDVTTTKRKSRVAHAPTDEIKLVRDVFANTDTKRNDGITKSTCKSRLPPKKRNLRQTLAKKILS